jgi:hypothetical protein
MPLRLTRPSPRGDQRDKAGCRPDRHPLTRDSPPPSIAQGEEGAAALGVRTTPVESPDRERAGAEVIVILGTDFKP